MTRGRNKINRGMDRWFFLISGVLVAILLIVAISTILFLSRQIFQSFAPIPDGEQEIKYDLEGYRNLNSLVGDET